MRAALSLAAILIAASIVPAGAQQVPELLADEEAEETVEPIRRYTVELIIFAYGESVSAGNEVFIPDQSAIESSDDTGRKLYFGDLDEELSEIEEPAIGRRYMDLELALLGKDDYTMNGIYDKLVKLEAYEPLVRAGWTQPTYEREVTASIPLATLAKSPPWLDGELTLYLGRYLHLVVDLTMDADRSTEDAGESTSGALTFSDTSDQNRYGQINTYGNLLQPPVHYRIFEDRIMKNGDIRYFDHPKFGVIAKTTRFEEPEDEEKFFDDTDDLLPAR
jgi:hypothetical protein